MILGEQQGFSLSEPGADERFLQASSHAFARVKDNAILLHGKRVEEMFAFVVGTLGKARVLRQEDSGEIYAADDNLQPPDYRAVLKSGYEFLIEVKSYYQRDPKRAYVCKSAYLKKLQAYAAIFGRDLKLAIYWSRWNLWTLHSLDRLTETGDRSVIDLSDAMRWNEMYLFGDLMLGTVAPLRLRILPAPDKPHSVDAQGRCPFTIGAVEVYSDSTRIEERCEKQRADVPQAHP